MPGIDDYATGTGITCCGILIIIFLILWFFIEVGVIN